MRTLLALPSSSSLSQLRAGARYVLTLAATGGTKSAQGAITDATYDARLIDREVKDHMIWRAEMHLYPGSALGSEDPGMVVARDLLMKLDADQVIAPCPGLRQRKLEQDREDEARRRGRR